MVPPILRFNLFGRPEIIVQCPEFAPHYHPLAKNQQSEILLYLLLHSKRAVSRESLSACVGIQHQLGVPLKRLRDYLHDIALPCVTEIDTYITGTHKNSLLGLANCTSDLQEFEEVWEAWQMEPSIANRRHLRECLQMLSDKPFLEGFEDLYWLRDATLKRVHLLQEDAKEVATLVCGSLPIPERYFSRNHLQTIYGLLHSPSPPAPIALSGMPGVGKTTLVSHYVEQYKSNYDFVFLVNAEQSTTIQANYIYFYDLLFPEKSQITDYAKVTGFIKWLQKQENYLLVFDNLEHLTLLKDYAPVPLRGHLLITTRLLDLEETAFLIHVDCLTDEEGLQFIKRISEGIPPAYQFRNAQALQLAQQLGELPIALKTAITYVKQSQQTPERFLKSGVVRNISIDENLSDTFRSALQALSPLALNSLYLIAFLGPASVPEWALRLGVPECEWGKGLKTPVAWDRVRSELFRYSLCSGSPGHYELHRFVQAFIRNTVQREGHAVTMQRDAIRVINRALTCNIYSSKPDCEADYEVAEMSHRDRYHSLATHLETCLRYINKAESLDVNALHLLQKGVHYYLFFQGSITKAQGLCIQQERLLYHLFPILNREWIEASCLSASLNIYMKNDTCAKQYAIQARNYAKKLHLPLDDAMHCAVLETIAFLLLRMQKYRRALPFLHIALKHAQTTNQKTTLLLKLGDACVNLKQFEEGEQHILHAIELAHTLSEHDRTSLVVGYSTLGAIYTYWGNECHDTGKYTLAEKALAEGIRLGETHWGESHPFMADLLLKQGELLYYQGVEAGAKQVFERVLTICESSTYKNSRIHDCAERWLQKIAV